MIKNTIIATLITVIYFLLLGEFILLAFICLVPFFTFVVWGIEDFILETMRKIAFKRKFKREIEQIKISPKPTKAS